MALTLDEYAAWLETRDLPWPAVPEIDVPKAKPHLVRLPRVRAVLWTIYGTLVAIPPEGELLFEHPNDFTQTMALEKTINEFKMWGSMTRKPGQPSNYLGKMYRDLFDEQRLAPSPNEQYPERHAEKIWEGIVKRLIQKDYKIDTAHYGALNEFAQKIAYFFHCSLQATCCYHTADLALAGVAGAGLNQGVLADAQCFTMTQLKRGLVKLGGSVDLDMAVPKNLRFLSCDRHARKPSDRLFRHAAIVLAERQIEPSQILHVGSRIDRDIIPAKKLGMRTALFAGDKSSLSATNEQLKDPNLRPDLLITEPGQITECVG